MFAAVDFLPGVRVGSARALRLRAMPANRMNRDEFYAAMAPHDDARLRNVLWTSTGAGPRSFASASRMSCAADRPKISPKKEPPDPDAVLAQGDDVR